MTRTRNKEQNALARELSELLLDASDELRGAKVKSIEHLSGDGSGRRYFRVHLKGAAQQSVILVILSHEHGPVTHGGENLNQDDTFVNLSHYFNEFQIAVPRVICDGRLQGALLVQDVGDIALWRFAFGDLDKRGLQIAEKIGPQATVLLYKKAVDVIANIQKCSPTKECVAFSRYMGLDEYKIESRRFIDHYLVPREVPKRHLVVVEDFIEDLCQSVADHPRVLMHRDFMPWNIHVTHEGDIAVLDFQDAIVGSYVYDVISLIHDRDADYALGDEKCAHVVEYFKDTFELGQGFYSHYNEALLQRYLRLAGQFHLLTKKTGRPIYENWVPGCLRRVGKTLANMPQYSRALEVLVKSVPEIAEGAKEPWSFCKP